jgi:hypothetical protein
MLRFSLKELFSIEKARIRNAFQLLSSGINVVTFSSSNHLDYISGAAVKLSSQIIASFYSVPTKC